MIDSASVRSVLIVRPSALGDVCRTVPVLVSLRRAFPDATIDWVVQDLYVPAIAAHPDLTAAIPFPRRQFARWWHPRVAASLSRWMGDLRGRRYDLVVDAQGLGRSGLMTLMTGARRRIGSRDAREFAWLAYTRRIRLDRDLHAVDHMLGLLAADGIEPVYDLRLYVTDADRTWWANEMSRRQICTGAYEVLAPTGRWESKRWPNERWRALLDAPRPPAVIIGAPGEEQQIDGLLNETTEHVHNLVGLATIGQTMAIIEQSARVIATDSAPLHMAVGFDRPAVALFGPTDPARVGPWGERAIVLHKRRPGEPLGSYRRAGDELMRRITVDEVREVLERLREATAGVS